MTAAAWAKASGPRRRAATPDAIRLSSTGRGCYKPHPSASSGAAGSNGGGSTSAASNELAAILKPSAALFAYAHEPGPSESPGLQREPTFDERARPGGAHGLTAGSSNRVNGTGDSSRDSGGAAGSGSDGADAPSAGGIKLARAYYEQQSPPRESPPSRADTGDRTGGGGGSAGRAGAGEMFRASYAFDTSPPGSKPPAALGGIKLAGGADGAAQGHIAAGAPDDGSGHGAPASLGGDAGMGASASISDMDAKSLSAALRALQERQARLLQELTSTPSSASRSAAAPGQPQRGPAPPQPPPPQPPPPQPHQPSIPPGAAVLAVAGAAAAAVPAGGAPGSFSFPAPQPQSPISESPASLPPSQSSPSPPGSSSKSPLPPVPEAPQDGRYAEASGMYVGQRDDGYGHHASGRSRAAAGVASGGVSKKRPASPQRVAPFVFQDDEEEAEAAAGPSAAKAWEVSGQALGAGAVQRSRDDLWWPGQNGPRAPAVAVAGPGALQSPARSSRRPSVTEAAEAAAAAGAGVGGPLTALLGQLQAADGRGGGGVADVRGHAAAPVVVTHFSLASALSAAPQPQPQLLPHDKAMEAPAAHGSTAADGAWGYAAADDEEVEDAAEQDEEVEDAAEQDEEVEDAAEPDEEGAMWRLQYPPQRPSVQHPSIPTSLHPKQLQHHHNLLRQPSSQPPSATAAAEGSFFGDESIADAAGAPYSNTASPRLGVTLYDNHVYGDNSYSYGGAAAAAPGISNGGVGAGGAAVDPVPPEMHVAAVREMYSVGSSGGGGAATAQAQGPAGEGGGVPMMVGPVRIPTSIGHPTRQHLPHSRLGEALAVAADDSHASSSPPAAWVPLCTRHSSGASSPAIASSSGGGGHPPRSADFGASAQSARYAAAHVSDLAAAAAASAAAAAAQAEFETRMRAAAVAGMPEEDEQSTEDYGDSDLGDAQLGLGQGARKGIGQGEQEPVVSASSAAADGVNKRQRMGSATGSQASAERGAAHAVVPSLAASIAAALAGSAADGGSPPQRVQQHVPHPAMQQSAAAAALGGPTPSAGTGDSSSGWGSTLVTGSGGGGSSSGPVHSPTGPAALASASSASLALTAGGSASTAAVRRSFQQPGPHGSPLLGAHTTAAVTVAVAGTGARSSSLSGASSSGDGALRRHAGAGGSGLSAAGSTYGRPPSPGVKPLNLADVLRRSPSGGGQKG